MAGSFWIWSHPMRDALRIALEQREEEADRPFVAAVRAEGRVELFGFKTKDDRDVFISEIDGQEGVQRLKGDPIT
jgi:Holliday junction resolvasome RuvABC DNA-binding subunit